MAPCGDDCRVNDIPKPAAYPTGLHIKDFASNLALKPSLSRSTWYMPDRSMLLRTTSASCLLVCEMPLTPFSGLLMMYVLIQTWIHVHLSCLLLPTQNLQHLQARFQCLSDHRLVINPTKCDFGKSKLNFLSYTINTSGISLTLSMLRQFAPSWQFLRTWRHCTSLLASLLHCTTTDLPWCAEVLQPLQQALAADSFTSCLRASITG